MKKAIKNIVSALMACVLANTVSYGSGAFYSTFMQDKDETLLTIGFIHCILYNQSHEMPLKDKQKLFKKLISTSYYEKSKKLDPMSPHCFNTLMLGYFPLPDNEDDPLTVSDYLTDLYKETDIPPEDPIASELEYKERFQKFMDAIDKSISEGKVIGFSHDFCFHPSIKGTSEGIRSILKLLPEQKRATFTEALASLICYHQGSESIVDAHPYAKGNLKNRISQQNQDLLLDKLSKALGFDASGNYLGLSVHVFEQMINYNWVPVYYYYNHVLDPDKELKKREDLVEFCQTEGVFLELILVKLHQDEEAVFEQAFQYACDCLDEIYQNAEKFSFDKIIHLIN